MVRRVAISTGVFERGRDSIGDVRFQHGNVAEYRSVESAYEAFEIYQFGLSVTFAHIIFLLTWPKGTD